MNTISFSTKKKTNKTVKIKQQAAIAASLKYCAKEALPLKEDRNVLFLTDDAQLYCGTGANSEVKKISDVIVVNNAEALPDAGVPDKLYVTKKECMLFFWDGKEYISITSGGGGTSIIPSKIYEFDNAKSFPIDGAEKMLYIAKDTDYMYRYNAATKQYIQLARPATDVVIADRVAALESALANKANASALSSFAIKTDVDFALAKKADASTVAGFATKEQIDAAVAGKADKTALVDFATKTEINAAMANKVDAGAITSLASKVELTAAVSNKADKTDLANYRKTADKITENDLATELVAKINATGAGGTAYDDTAVKNDISALQTNKADKTAIEAINTEMATKADSTALANYRKISEAIEEADLSEAVKSKLNAVETGYDDTAIKTDVAGLHQTKADKTEIETLNTAIAVKADATAITSLQTDVTAAKTDAAQAKVDAAAAELQVSTLDSSVSKINTQVSSMQTSLTTAQIDLAKKADATALADYRKASDKIAAADLDQTVTASIEKVPTIETQLADAIARIIALEGGTSEVKNIVSFPALTAITVAYNTAFGALGLPSTVAATMSDNTTQGVAVTWEQGLYSATTAGAYTLTGTPSLTSAITNTGKAKPTIGVTVSAEGASKYAWEYEFTLDELDPEIKLSEIPGWNTANKFTTEDFYGTEASGWNGTGHTVEVRWIGYTTGRTYDPDGVLQPTSFQLANGIEKLSPDGALDYDPETEIINFANASLGKRIYKIVKLK